MFVYGITDIVFYTFFFSFVNISEVVFASDFIFLMRCERIKPQRGELSRPVLHTAAERQNRTADLYAPQRRELSTERERGGSEREREGGRGREGLKQRQARVGGDGANGPAPVL